MLKLIFEIAFKNINLTLRPILNVFLLNYKTKRKRRNISAIFVFFLINLF